MQLLLNGRYTCHLDRSLKGTAKEQTSERRPVLEQLGVRFSFVFMLEGDALLDLRVLGLNPGVIFISMSMKLCQGFQTLFGLIMIDQPTGRLIWLEIE